MQPHPTVHHMVRDDTPLRIVSLGLLPTLTPLGHLLLLPLHILRVVELPPSFLEDSD